MGLSVDNFTLIRTSNLLSKASVTETSMMTIRPYDGQMFINIKYMYLVTIDE